jgi:hypothetical protein
VPQLQNDNMELEARIAAVQQIALFAIQLIDDQHVANGNPSPVDVFLGFLRGFDPATTGATGPLLDIERRQLEIVIAQLARAKLNREGRQAQG